MFTVEELKKEYARCERIIDDAFWADRLTPAERRDVENAHRRQREIKNELAKMGITIEE